MQTSAYDRRAAGTGEPDLSPPLRPQVLLTTHP